MMATCGRPTAAGTTCRGEIEDGYCNLCGKAAQGVTNIVASPSAEGGATRSTGTVGSAAATRGAHGARSSRRHTRGSTSRRQALGGGLISLPPMPSQEPLALVMKDPAVSIGKRRCPKCNNRVNRVKGFCTNCGEGYDFEPKLHPGDIVAGKYEVKGAIAFGGMGWVYLGWDQVLSRWVVLKGLLNAKDEAAAAAAVAERQFLADVKHGRIVGIYDFVSDGSESFMVLEYVGGRTLESLRDEKGPLPPAEAIAYILGILPAFAYLHARKFVYCDFKPGNLMLEGDDVKLIDMGAVRRIGDPNGDVFATDGYAAKEAGDDPTEVSDLYTLGRTLAVLLMDFLWTTKTETDRATGQSKTTRQMRAAYKDALPSPTDQPVLAEHESLYRFLLKACHDDPDERFQSADEMEGQLFGVLRQVVGKTDGPKPADSRVFLGDGLRDGQDREGARAPLARCLPTLRVDVADKAAALVSSAMTIADPSNRRVELERARSKFPNSPEVNIRIMEAMIETGELSQARSSADTMLRHDEFEWRYRWMLGKVQLAAGDPRGALDTFERVYGEIPGELAPMVACGFAAETAGDAAHARKRYGAVVATDPNYVSACFGLARTMPSKTVDALDAVPDTSALSSEARSLKIEELTRTIEAGQGDIVGQSYARAAKALDKVNGGPAKSIIAGNLYAAVAGRIDAGTVALNDSNSAGAPTQPGDVRRAAEANYREAAKWQTDPGERERLIDLANTVRSWSLT